MIKRRSILFLLLIFGIQTGKLEAQNAEKEADREARQFEKAGWASMDASTTVENMLNKTWQKEIQRSAQGDLMWLWAEATASADISNMAEGQATNFAKYNLIGQIQTSLEEIVTENARKLNLSIELTDAIVSAIRNSKSDMLSALVTYKPDLRISKKNRENSIDVLVRLYIPKDTVTETAKRIMCKTVLENVKVDIKLLCQIFSVNTDCEKFISTSRSIRLNE